MFLFVVTACHQLDRPQNFGISVNVISKSGTTTEPALAFRIFCNYLEQKYGKEEEIYFLTFFFSLLIALHF